MTPIVINQAYAPPIWLPAASTENVPNGATAKKIRSFGKLPSGWHYGSGRAASREIIVVSLEYLSYFTMAGFLETDAFPGVDGEVMLTAYKGRHCLELTVEIDKSFSIAHQFDQKDRSYDTDLSGIAASLEIARIVAEIEQEECNLLGWLTQGTTIPGNANLGLLHSLYLTAGLPSLTRPVASAAVGQYAPMSIASTLALEVTQPSFGPLIPHASMINAR